MWDTIKTQENKLEKLKSTYYYIKAICNPKSKKYNGSKICKEWDSYNSFKRWCLDNGWNETKSIYAENFYSPETCEILDTKKCKVKKQKYNNLKKYGEDHYSKTQEYKDKIRKTCIAKYGVEHFTQTSEYKEKYKKSLKDKYGVENQFQREDIKQKSKKTNLEKYNSEYVLNNPEIKQKSYETKVKNGSIKLYNGKNLTEISKELNITPSAVIDRIKKHGTKKIFNKKHESYLEKIFINNILDKNNIEYEKQFNINGKIADFKIGNLLIECDGLYWHSEAKRDKKYHKEKREFYITNGYYPIFFYEDEILENPEIISSIILNKINKSHKIFARKCEIKELTTKDANLFFSENHLMGKGQGKSIGLIYNKEIISAIRFKKIKDGIDISRFCHRIKHTTIGGFSKLIKYLEINIKPSFIQTFIDLRYGSGDYLEGMNFTKTSENLSFYWILNKKRFHRLNFKGNSGYKHNMLKIWDCGQRKYVKEINK